MRFNNDTYLKAFPRSEKTITKVEVAAGNVIEEAEAATPAAKPAEPEAPGNMIEDAPAEADQAADSQEGADNGS